MEWVKGWGTLMEGGGGGGRWSEEEGERERA